MGWFSDFVLGPMGFGTDAANKAGEKVAEKVLPAPPTPPAPAAPPPPPPPPTVEDASLRGQQSADALARRRGMASTILAGGSGSAVQPMTTAARLLGS